MKKTTFLLTLMLSLTIFAQNNNGVIDAAGDIMFVAYDPADDDGLAFLLLDDAPNNTTITLTDTEWNGTAFETGEGDLTWVNNTGATIKKGKVIIIDNADGDGITTNFGLTTETDTGYGGANGDQVIALLGTRDNPGTFLTSHGDEKTVNSGEIFTFSGTGLTNGVNAFAVNQGTGLYTGTTVFNGALAEVSAAISDPANWTFAVFSPLFPVGIPTEFTGTVFSDADTTAPTIASISNQELAVAANCTATLPDYTGLAIVSDDSDPSPTVTQSPAAGTLVSGLTVEITVTDDSGNSNKTSFTVNLTDTTAPTISSIIDQSQDIGVACSTALLDYTNLAIVSDNCDSTPTVTQSPAVGSSISNTTSVTLTVEDASGNKSDTSFNVLLNQTNLAVTAPTSVCSGDEATITISDSEIGTIYSLRDNTDNSIIGKSIHGNDSNISFTTNTLTQNKEYNVYVESASLNSTSLNFDGADDRVLLTTTGLSVSGSYTVEAWAKPNKTTGTLTIFSTRYYNRNLFDFKLQNGNKIHGDIGDGLNWITTSADANFNYNANEWIHIAYVVKQTGYNIYANGVNVASGTFTSTESPLLTNSFNPIIIGGLNTTQESFEGQIDEVRVWNVARSAAEIQNNYNISIDPSQAGLIAYYDFNDGTGSSTLSDLTSNNYNGTLSNIDISTAWLVDPIVANNSCAKQLSPLVNISVDNLDDANFLYGASSYNTNETDPTPTITGLTGGVFSTSSSDLTIDTTSGAIDLDESFVGVYTITYTTNGTCSNSSTFDVTITGTALSTSNNILEKVAIYSSSKNQLIIKGLIIKANLTVYSLLGKEVVRTTLEANDLIKIDLPTLSKGVYIVRLVSDSGFTTNKKIVLE